MDPVPDFEELPETVLAVPGSVPTLTTEEFDDVMRRLGEVEHSEEMEAELEKHREAHRNETY